MDRAFCKHLRTKKMYVEAEPEAALRQAPDAEFAPCHFWCNLTQSAVGPDDRPVHKDQCTPGRNCFRDG